jgi:hypothetical protein
MRLQPYLNLISNAVKLRNTANPTAGFDKKAVNLSVISDFQSEMTNPVNPQPWNLNPTGPQNHRITRLKSESCTSCLLRHSRIPSSTFSHESSPSLYKNYDLSNGVLLKFLATQNQYRSRGYGGNNEMLSVSQYPLRRPLVAGGVCLGSTKVSYRVTRESGAWGDIC